MQDGVSRVGEPGWHALADPARPRRPEQAGVHEGSGGGLVAECEPVDEDVRFAAERDLDASAVRGAQDRTRPVAELGVREASRRGHRYHHLAGSDRLILNRRYVALVTADMR